MKLRVPENRNFFSICATGGFSRRTQLHVVSYLKKHRRPASYRCNAVFQFSGRTRFESHSGYNYPDLRFSVVCVTLEMAGWNLCIVASSNTLLTDHPRSFSCLLDVTSAVETVSWPYARISSETLISFQESVFELRILCDYLQIDKEIFLCIKASRQAPGPTQPPIQ
jgi:hypothetical protein